MREVKTLWTSNPAFFELRIRRCEHALAAAHQYIPQTSNSSRYAPRHIRAPSHGIARAHAHAAAPHVPIQTHARTHAPVFDRQACGNVGVRDSKFAAVSYEGIV
jgi:hypothetical protein